MYLGKAHSTYKAACSQRFTKEKRKKTMAVQIQQYRNVKHAYNRPKKKSELKIQP